jgi:hypothetical protein
MNRYKQTRIIVWGNRNIIFVIYKTVNYKIAQCKMILTKYTTVVIMAT